MDFKDILADLMKDDGAREILERKVRGLDELRGPGIGLGRPRGPMTVEQRLRKYLLDNGLLEPEIGEILKKVKADETLKTVRFSDSEAGYPKPLLGALVYIAKREAITYLKENCPMHFALHMLEDTLPELPGARSGGTA